MTKKYSTLITTGAFSGFEKSPFLSQKIDNISLCQDKYESSNDEIEGEVEDNTIAYILQIKEAFEILRQCASQIAGLLIFSMSKKRNHLKDFSLIDATDKNILQAILIIKNTNSNEKTRNHYSHINKAALLINESFSLFKKYKPPFSDDQVDQILLRIKLSWKEMQKAASILPGFEVIDLKQSCCAYHASIAKKIGK